MTLTKQCPACCGDGRVYVYTDEDGEVPIDRYEDCPRCHGEKRVVDLDALDAFHMCVVEAKDYLEKVADYSSSATYQAQSVAREALDMLQKTGAWKEPK